MEITITKHIENAKTVIEKEFQSIKKLESIALELNCNYSTLRRSFVKHTGTTLGSYLNKIRCQKARLYLECTDWKMYKIAVKVGFSNENYFCKVFKRYYGKYSSNYRI